MKNVILMAVQDKGAFLFMTDGTAWKINPEFLAITSKWQPPCVIEVSDKSNDKNFDYTLTHSGEGSSVTAIRHK